MNIPEKVVFLHIPVGVYSNDAWMCGRKFQLKVETRSDVKEVIRFWFEDSPRGYFFPEELEGAKYVSWDQFDKLKAFL